MAHKPKKLQNAANNLKKIIDGHGISPTCTIFTPCPGEIWTERDKRIIANIRSRFHNYFDSWVAEDLQALIDAHLIYSPDPKIKS